MSTAVCLTDAKDLAVDPATTVEDTQHTRESIISYTNSLLLRVSYTICPPVSSISHAYLLPFLHLCPIHFLSMPSPLTKMQSLSGSFYPKHFLKLLWAYLYPCATLLHPLSIIHSVHVSYFLPFTPHSLPHPLPLYPQPTAWLSLGRGEQCRPTWGPEQSQSRRKGAPENTHNSMFRTGLWDKGKPHTWLTMWVSLGSFVEAEGSNWHQNPPLRVCMYVCEKECVMSPYSLVVRAPLQFIPGSFSMGNLPLSLPPPPTLLPSSSPILYAHAATMSLWAPWTKQGALWGHQLVLPHGATWPMNGETPKPSTHIISVFSLEAVLSSPHRLHLVFRKIYFFIRRHGPLLQKKRKKKRRASGCTESFLSGEWNGTCSTCWASSWRAPGMGFRRRVWGVGEFFPSIIEWHKQQ